MTKPLPPFIVVLCVTLKTYGITIQHCFEGMATKRFNVSTILLLIVGTSRGNYEKRF